MTLPSAHDFLALAVGARTCVAARESAQHASPPSEPQLSVGAEIAPLLKADAFVHPEQAGPARRKRPAKL